ncbi:MAG: glucose-6-phosphate isomerase [archaeon]|nr:glucose-6-phosphate isomerase [archaeon]
MATIDLEKISDLPIKLNKNSLEFGKRMKKVVPEARTHKRMLPVLKNPEEKAPEEFYYMYRDVAIESDRELIRKNNLRFDITILPPFLVGDEYNKTFGHYHPKVPGTFLGGATWWPEIYEVLHGRAHYLLQNGSEFLVFDARPGDKCVMLPGFGHITVNPSGKEALVMANWVFPGFASDYGPIEKLGGGQWFETTKGFVANKKYGEAPNVQLISPRDFEEFGFSNSRPMYADAIANPAKFEWLSKPQNYLELFKKYRET